MSKKIQIGLIVEGSTDSRFLESVIHRTFKEITYEHQGAIEISSIKIMKRGKSVRFLEDVQSLAKEAWEIGIHILCVHKDADNQKTNRLKLFKKTFQSIQKQENVCTNLIQIMPIHMTEAWMLADKVLFKKQLGTNKSDKALGIDKRPEKIREPKQAILEAIRIAFDHLPKRRSRPIISELYQPIGSQVDLKQLEALSSFCEFKQAVQESCKKLLSN